MKLAIFLLGILAVAAAYPEPAFNNPPASDQQEVDCYADDFCQHFITRTIDCCFGGRSYKFFPGALCQHC